jgi:hypothetical protein
MTDSERATSPEAATPSNDNDTKHESQEQHNDRDSNRYDDNSRLSMAYTRDIFSNGTQTSTAPTMPFVPPLLAALAQQMSNAAGSSVNMQQQVGDSYVRDLNTQ